MTLKDSVQTAFLIVGIFTLLVFGVSYYFVLIDNVPTQQPLKDALSITASFFGGFATLTAAYIASKLFNDWKMQHNAFTKANYINNILSILRKDLISIAPILNKAIVAGEKYQHLDEVSTINFDINVINDLYASHKTTELLFKEYYSAFKDDNTYLLYLKFNCMMEKTLNSLLNVEKIDSDLEKLEEMTRQLQIVAIPHKLNNKTVSNYNVCEMFPIDLYRQVEVNYFSIVDYLTTYRLQE